MHLAAFHRDRKSDVFVIDGIIDIIDIIGIIGGA